MPAQRPHRVINMEVGQELNLLCHAYASGLSISDGLVFTWHSTYGSVVTVTPTGMVGAGCKLKAASPGVSEVTCVALSMGAQAPQYDDLVDTVIVSVGRTMVDDISIDDA